MRDVMKLLDSINMKSITSLLFKNKVLFAAFLLTYITFLFVFFETVAYSRLNLMVYYGAFAFLLLIILVLSIVSFEGVYEKKKKLQRTGLIGFILLSLVFTTASYYLIRINSSINNVITDQNADTVLNLAFVTYDNSTITDISTMDGKKIGILSNAETTDRNSYVKDVISENALNVTYVEYLSYNELLLGLFAGDVQVAALPADYVNQFENNEGYSEYLNKTNIIYEFSTSIASTATENNIDVSKDPFTVLIMGNDGGRTDSVILATYNPLRLEVTMTSIPRDSYIPIACYPNQAKDKMGHAFAVSRDCAIQTVENLLNVTVDYYVVVNFTGVVDIVDALDKIWLESPLQFVGQNSSEIRGQYTVWIPKGGFWATGEQALTFARERHLMPGGDFQRQENQQQVIRSIIDKTLQLRDVNKALAVLDAAGTNIETNMPLNQMITIFNDLMKAINRTSVTPTYILDLIGSQITGYFSWTYNEAMQLPLSIIIPYQGSLADNEELINSNLNTDATLPSEVKMNFNANSVFFSPDYFSRTYIEKEVHEVLPDFMPQMSYNDWTLSDVRTWAASRGISIVENKVVAGDSKYSDAYEFNFIVGQSVKYGVKTSTFKSLTVDVIKRALDCSVSDNMKYDECKYRLPDFANEGYKTVDVQTWAANNGITLKYTIIPETDSTYDKTKIGYVISQSPTLNTVSDIRTISSITLTIMDSNYSVTIPDSSTWTVADAKAWVAANLSTEDNYAIVYVATADSTKVGKISSISPASGSKIKYKDSLTINVFGESMTLANYVGGTKTALQTSLCTPGLALCTFTSETTTDSSLVGTIKSQSIAAGTLKLKSVWATTTISFVEYVADTSSSTPSGT